MSQLRGRRNGTDKPPGFPTPCPPTTRSTIEPLSTRARPSTTDPRVCRSYDARRWNDSLDDRTTPDAPGGRRRGTGVEAERVAPRPRPGRTLARARAHRTGPSGEPGGDDGDARSGSSDAGAVHHTPAEDRGIETETGEAFDKGGSERTRRGCSRQRRAWDGAPPTTEEIRTHEAFANVSHACPMTPARALCPQVALAVSNFIAMFYGMGAAGLEPATPCL